MQSSTCKQIYELLERQASSEDLKEQKVRQVHKSSIKTKAKFVISEDSQGYLIGKHGFFTKQLEDKGIYMHCGTDSGNEALRPREAVCSLEGTLEDIEEGTIMLVKRLESYYETSKKDYESVPLAFLIPRNLITKIIGQGGSQIKKLVREVGANIRFCCSKHDQQKEDVVVTIDGKLVQKQRGAIAVLQQVEICKAATPFQIIDSERRDLRRFGYDRDNRRVGERERENQRNNDFNQREGEFHHRGRRESSAGRGFERRRGDSKDRKEISPPQVKRDQSYWSNPTKRSRSVERDAPAQQN